MGRSTGDFTDCLNTTPGLRASSPCAGAVLVFSAWFQIQRTLPEGNMKKVVYK